MRQYRKGISLGVKREEFTCHQWAVGLVLLQNNRWVSIHLTVRRMDTSASAKLASVCHSLQGMKEVNTCRTHILWKAFEIYYLRITKSLWWLLLVRANSWGPERSSNLPSHTATSNLSSICFPSGQYSTHYTHCSHGRLLLPYVSVEFDNCIQFLDSSAV